MGEWMSVGAAFVWSISVILFKQTGTFSPLGLNLFKNIIGIVALGATLWFMGEPLEWERSDEDWARLWISGVLGIGLADSLFFAALNRLGAGLLAVVECAYAPFVVLSSVLLLGESLSPSFILGGSAVFVGLLLATMDPSLKESLTGTTDLKMGVFYGVLGVAVMAFGIVIAKPALENSNLIEVTQMRLLMGTFGLVVWVGIRGNFGYHLAPFRIGPHWKNLAPGAFLGTYLAMIFWVGGMKYTSASVAGILSQTATVFTLFFSWLILKEGLSVQKVLGAVAAIAGALVIGLGSAAP